jgi:hypothetical protein
VNALGDVAPVGKNPKVGDDGGEKYEGIMFGKQQ